MKIQCSLIILFGVYGLSSSIAEEKCKGDDCVHPWGIAFDQDCNLDRTLVSRCYFYSPYMTSDKELNFRYRNLIKKLDKEYSTILKETQLKWIKWRSEKCEEVNDSVPCDTGICANYAHDVCIIDLTNQRTNELIQFQKDVSAAKKNFFEFSTEYEYEK